MPAQKVLNIVRKKVWLSVKYAEDWEQEALAGYEQGRLDHPDNEGEHIFAAIQAVQRLIRRERREHHTDFHAVANVCESDDQSDDQIDEQRASFRALLAREDAKTREIFMHLLSGRTQIATSLAMGLSPSQVNTRLKKFIKKARSQIKTRKT
jgi:hypothetical protein